MITRQNELSGTFLIGKMNGAPQSTTLENNGSDTDDFSKFGGYKKSGRTIKNHLKNVIFLKKIMFF